MNGIMDIESKMNGIMDIENIIINTDLINDITKDLFDLANKRNVLKASIHSIQMKEDSVQFVPYTHQKKIFVVYAIYNKYSWINSPRKKTRVYKFRIVECSCGRHIEKLNENPIYRS